MAIALFRGDTIQLKHTVETHEDANGNLVEGESYYDEPFECTAEPSGAANTMTFQDGQTKKYSYTVHVGQDCPDYHIGDVVKITFHDGREHEYTVLGFHRYYIKGKLWV